MAIRHPATQEQPYYLTALGSLGLLGCLVLLVGTLVAPFFVSDYNWVSDTISDLAAGHSEIVMDVALYGFAAGLVATALAASHSHRGTIGWSFGVLSLAILAALVVIIAARNEYGDGDSEGVVVHAYLVYGLGALFLIVPACMAPSLGGDHGWAKWTLIGLAVLWCAAAPVFLLAPTSVDGLIERALGLIACAIIGTLCAVFVHRGRTALNGRADRGA
ncbi:MAG: DUF998 domain-containing protein [Inquilinaceae bacterium]